MLPLTQTCFGWRWHEPVPFKLQTVQEKFWWIDGQESCIQQKTQKKRFAAGKETTPDVHGKPETTPKRLNPPRTPCPET